MQAANSLIRSGHSYANEPHKAGRLLDVIPQEAGPRLKTFRGGAIHSIRPPGEHTFLTPDTYAAVVLSPCPGMESAFASDRTQRFDAPAGMLVISPAHVESRAMWPSVRENITVALPTASLLELAEHEFDIGKVDLHPIPFGTIDQKALCLAQTLKAELTRPNTANELYVDSLITFFGIHLLRNYTSFTKARAEFQRGLPNYKAKMVRDFLHENLSAKVSVADLARVCGLSAGHFIKAFARTFGRTPHQYLLDLRLAHAERLLVESDLTISEIAYLSGFSSQSHLTESMRKHKHVTPHKIRQAR